MSEELEIVIPKKAFLPCYYHLLKEDPTIDIDLLFGGRDSGKSRFIAQRLIVKCLSVDYFRCVLARKIFATIKDSQWQLIKDIVEQWGLDHLFTFKVSPLEIVCVNGNKFICRGFDEPTKIKSLSEVSDAWVEEGNQITQDDFLVLITTLRTNKAKVKTWFSFNPEADNGEYKEFWLYKAFYEKYNGNIYSNFTYKWEMPVGTSGGSVQYTYRNTWTTYKDNPFVTQTRKAILEYMAILDPYYEKVFTKGFWGNRQVGDPFCYSFNRDKHVKPCELNNGLELYLSFDFNVNPITCGVYQHYGTTIICREAIKLNNSDIYKMCAYIKNKYKRFSFLVTGDATGRATSALAQDGINYYTVIKDKLDLAPTQIKAPTVNPKIAENRVLVNAVLSQMDVRMHPTDCKDLIFDCENVAVDDLGDIDKGDRKNPKKRADHLDNFRYYLNTFHRNILRGM